MKLTVLGCSGGIGGNRHTSAFLLDDDILLDAGTGVGQLSLDALTRIDHIFVTHSHLDHVTSIPFLIDSVCSYRHRPITIYGLPETLKTLQDHVFNWKIWPDFATIPNAHSPFMCYHPLESGQSIQLNGRHLRLIPAQHVVPAVGYAIDGHEGTLIYSGDTRCNRNFWQMVNAIPNVRHLLIESAFPNEQQSLAELAQHLTPASLQRELQHLNHPHAHVWITHMKPGKETDLTQELAHVWPQLGILQPHQEIDF